MRQAGGDAHPNLAEAYRRKVEELALTLDMPELEARKAHQALRDVVDLITAEPRD